MVSLRCSFVYLESLKKTLYGDNFIIVYLFFLSVFLNNAKKYKNMWLGL